MMEAPWSRAVMAAGSPATPAPITTTSADRSHLRGEALWALASCAPVAAKTAPAAPVDRKARRLTSPAAAPARSVAFLPMFPPRSIQSQANAYGCGLHPAFPLRGDGWDMPRRRDYLRSKQGNLDFARGRVKTAGECSPNQETHKRPSCRAPK